jgi:hypothetical protein
MAGRGRKFVFHGAYSPKHKREAVHEEHKLGHRGFIIKRKIKGHVREIVLTRRKGK